MVCVGMEETLENTLDLSETTADMGVVCSSGHTGSLFCESLILDISFLLLSLFIFVCFLLSLPFSHDL